MFFYNENLLRKILEGRRYEGEGLMLECSNVGMFEWGFRRFRKFRV
jgi:hypothetical protein